MAVETTRVVTGKQTIPAYTAYSGSELTTNTDSTVVLDYTAGALTAYDVFGADLQGALKDNVWVYSPSSNTDGEVRKVKGVNSNEAGTTWSIIVESAFTTALVDVELKLVTANLQDYSVGNQGGAAGIYDNISLASGATVARSENSNRRAATRYRDAKIVEATGTSFLITENK